MINIENHYWIIGGSATEAYSSKSNTRVAQNDADFAAWKASFAPTQIESEEELAEVMRQYQYLPRWLLNAPSFIQPSPDAYNKDQLKAYSDDARARKNNGGIVVNGIPFPSDMITLEALNAAYIYTQANLGSTFSWKLPDGSFITLDKAQVEQLQAAVAKFGQDCFACEDATATAIDGGSITDLPGIDAAYDAVSNEFTSTITRRRK